MDKEKGNQQRQKQSSPSARRSTTSSRSRRRPVLFIGVSLLGLLGVGVAAIYLLSQQETDSNPVDVGTAADMSVNITATSPATAVPPTEPPQEVALQQQLRDLLKTVVGVNDILSLDIDVPGDEPPLIYVEISVSPGYNNTNIPDAFVAKVNETLNTTQYSDLVVIISDESQTVEYTFDSQNLVWSRNVLSGTAPTDS
jgi:hypothetical protein